MINILCFGDSNTWGYDSDKHERFQFADRYPGVIEGTLGADKVKVYENGIGGRTTCFYDPVCRDANGYESVIPALRAATPLDVIIVMLGTNDTKIHLGQKAYSIAKGMDMIVNDIELYWSYEAVNNNVKKPLVIITAPADIDTLHAKCPCIDFDANSSNIIKELRPLYKNIAEARGAGFLDAGLYAKPGEKDGVHITAEGHKALGKALAEMIAKKLNI